MPANFRRPVHSDGVAAVENFIRAKYQRKDFVPPGIPAPHEVVAKGDIPIGSSYAKATSADVSPKRKLSGLNLLSESPKAHSPKHASPRHQLPPGSVDLLGGFSPTGSSRTANYIAPSFFSASQSVPQQFSAPSMIPHPAALPVSNTNSVSGYARPGSPKAGSNSLHHSQVSSPKGSSKPTRPLSSSYGVFEDIDPFAVFADKK